MPELDGFGVLEALQKEGCPVKVIVISADIQTMAYERAITLGAKAFIQKPVTPSDIEKVAQEAGLL